jgi:CheY-like chemotaxis protein
MPDERDNDAAPLPIACGEADVAIRPRILAVDDNLLILLSTVDMIEDLGYEAIEANDGEQALEILRGDSVIDALLTDFSMPRMSGMELAEAALALRPGLPILLASGYSEMPSGEKFEFPCLSKPYQQSQLSEAINKLLRR